MESMGWISHLGNIAQSTNDAPPRMTPMTFGDQTKVSAMACKIDRTRVIAVARAAARGPQEAAKLQPLN